jgi:hypothetical protein
MEEYKVVDRVYPNYLEPDDLIKVKGEVYQVLNLKDTSNGFDIIVLDNYQETRVISVPDDKLVNIVLDENQIQQP